MPRKKKTQMDGTEETKNEDKVETAEKKEETDVTTEEKKESKPKRTRKKKETSEKTEEVSETDDKKAKLKKVLEEKAKELEAKIDKKPEEKDMKEEVVEGEKKRIKRNQKTLFPLDDYVKYSAHLGTKAITPHMRKFVYKRRADGLAVLNTNAIDENLKIAAEFLKDFAPGDVFLACKREAGWKAAKKFSEVTGIKTFTKKYPAGIITNIQLEDFFETDLIIICDPWLDKNALNDASKVKRPVIGLCDTNNLTTGITKVIPCNNKSSKSIGLILYLLAREYLISRKQEKDAENLKLEDFTGVDESELEQKEERREKKSEKRSNIEGTEQLNEETSEEKKSQEHKEEKTDSIKVESKEEESVDQARNKEEKEEIVEMGASEGV